MRYPLIGGSYLARSRIANAQRCVNYYPENNREDSPTPLTFYQRPGNRQLVDSGNASAVRCLYQASNGQGFCVIGQKVYYISPSFALTLLGSLLVFDTNQCKMIDNGRDILLCDGSPLGYNIHLADHVFSQIVDPTGAFQGANTLGYLDTFIVWNNPGTIQFGSTLSNVMTFDALYFGGKTGYPDPLVALNVNRREILLLGAYKSEIWYDAGAATFPFAILPGAYIEHGCAAKYSVATIDITTMWLGRDLQGQGVVFALKAYDVVKMSNHALDLAMQKMSRIDDAIAYTYQREGHYFYVLTFPTGDQTWVFDSTIKNPDGAWSQRAWADLNGNLHRERGNCYAALYGKNVVGDWENGKLYELDTNYFFDDKTGTPSSITCIKGFPHLFMAFDPTTGQNAPTEGKRIVYTSFKIDMETGEVPLNSDGTIGEVTMRYSSNRGKTFDTTLLQDIGAPGEYNSWPQWQALGMSRDMVFEVYHSLAGPAALNGAWVDAMVQAS